MPVRAHACTYRQLHSRSQEGLLYEVFVSQQWTLSPAWCSRQLKHLYSCPCAGGQTQGLAHAGIGEEGRVILYHWAGCTPSPEFSCSIIVVISKSDISDPFLDSTYPPLHRSVDTYCSMGRRQEAGQDSSGRKQILKAVNSKLLRYGPYLPLSLPVYIWGVSLLNVGSSPRAQTKQDLISAGIRKQMLSVRILRVSLTLPNVYSSSLLL